MKLSMLVLAATALVPAGTAQAQDAKAMLQKSGCTACHSEDKKLVGPAYKDVAAKYRSDKGAEAKLFDKVKKGGTGAWGQVPMPPKSAVPDADVKALVKWIMSQK